MHTPKYRYHKARDCAVVTIAGRDQYLGDFDSTASWEMYHRLIAEHLAGDDASPTMTPPDPYSLTITELAARYWKHATAYYVKDGRPTTEIDMIKQALCFLRRHYASLAAAEFSPQKLKALQAAMVLQPIMRRRRITDPLTKERKWALQPTETTWSRSTINKVIGRIKRVFAWAVAEELLPVAVHAALLRVPGLRRGRTQARELPRVRPVADEHVQAILGLVSPTIADMVRVQRLCGCRPQDVVYMRAEAINRTGNVWEYRPQRHKTEHHNDANNQDLDRVVYIGPQAQRILASLLAATPPDEYVFSPARSEEERRRPASLPSGVAGAAVTKAMKSTRQCRDHYDDNSYRRAIQRACQKAGIPAWAPNQLRHSRLTEIRDKYDLEASKVCAGQRSITVTQFYAEQNRNLARRVMSEIG